MKLVDSRLNQGQLLVWSSSLDFQCLMTDLKPVSEQQQAISISHFLSTGNGRNSRKREVKNKLSNDVKIKAAGF